MGKKTEPKKKPEKLETLFERRRRMIDEASGFGPKKEQPKKKPKKKMACGGKTKKMASGGKVTCRGMGAAIRGGSYKEC